jgi:thioredoxin 1
MTREWSRAGGRAPIAVIVTVGVLIVVGAAIVAERGSLASRPRSAGPASGALAPAPPVAEAPSPEGPAGDGLPKLLDLGSVTCVPCRAMAPVLEEMRATFRGQLDVEFIDVRQDPDRARSLGIKVIPTQVFLDADGKELFRHRGFYSREDILARWAELGYELHD